MPIEDGPLFLELCFMKPTAEFLTLPFLTVHLLFFAFLSPCILCFFRDSICLQCNIRFIYLLSYLKRAKSSTKLSDTGGMFLRREPATANCHPAGAARVIYQMIAIGDRRQEPAAFIHAVTYTLRCLT